MTKTLRYKDIEKAIVSGKRVAMHSDDALGQKYANEMALVITILRARVAEPGEAMAILDLCRQFIGDTYRVTQKNVKLTAEEWKDWEDKTGGTGSL